MTSATPAESSKIMKRELQKRFQATRFSVRIGRGTAWGSCYVSWTDGPSSELVKEITTRYEGQGFDGMTDSTYYLDTMMSDGRESGLGLILEQRHISPQFARRIAQAVATFYGIDPPEIKEADGGYWEISDTNGNVAGSGASWYSLIHRAAANRASIYPETP